MTQLNLDSLSALIHPSFDVRLDGRFHRAPACVLRFLSAHAAQDRTQPGLSGRQQCGNPSRAGAWRRFGSDTEQRHDRGTRPAGTAARISEPQSGRGHVQRTHHDISIPPNRYGLTVPTGTLPACNWNSRDKAPKRLPLGRENMKMTMPGEQRFFSVQRLHIRLDCWMSPFSWFGKRWTGATVRAAGWRIMVVPAARFGTRSASRSVANRHLCAPTSAFATACYGPADTPRCLRVCRYGCETCDLTSKFTLGSEQAPWLKRLLWAIQDFFNALLGRGNRLQYLAARRAILDYAARRFGDYSDEVRAWSRAWTAQQRTA